MEFRSDLVRLMMAALLVALSSAEKYTLGEEGVRGTQIILSLALPSKITCAGVCESEATCKGFNWLLSKKICEPLYSLREVTSEFDCNLYVQDFPDSKISVVPLEFSCSTCQGASSPTGRQTWVHQCLPRRGSAAVGLAWREGSQDDLDYLICMEYPGLTINLRDGGVVPDSRICAIFIRNTFVAVSVWSDKQYYDQPGSLAYQCREVISGEQVDVNRCLTPAVAPLYPPGAVGPLVGRQCPPHMVAVNMYWAAATAEARFSCCLLY